MKCQRRGTNFKIMERLKLHAAIKAELQAAGWTEEEASAEAFKRVTNPERKLPPSMIIFD